MGPVGPLRVLVTRASEDAGSLGALLQAAGLEPVHLPLLRRQIDAAAVAEGVRACPAPDVLLLTSAAAARALAPDARAIHAARVACVGPATAEAARAIGLTPHDLPERATGVDLVRALGDLTGLTVLYVRAEEVVPATGDALREAGATVVDVIAYRTRTGPDRDPSTLGPVDVVTLASPSAARAWHEAAPDRSCPVACIGPTTATEARRLGLRVVAEAAPHTTEGLVEAVVTWAAGPR